jgi:predicted Zn-dependent protease
MVSADAYLRAALTAGNGYPVVESWAAAYYWRTGRLDLAQRYAHYATYKQPRYLENWLLLTKIYSQKGNLKGMEWALDKAHALVPGNLDLAKMRKVLRDTRDVHAVDLRPNDVSTIIRLH